MTLSTPSLAPGSPAASITAPVKYFSGLQRHILLNQHAYANDRVAKGLTPEPGRIISDYGLAHANPFGAKYSWMWLPPKAGSYNIFPRGRIRKFSYICIHSFGYAIQNHILRKDRNRLTTSADPLRFNPKVWKAGVTTLTSNPDIVRAQRPASQVRRVSIHFCLSRRGDVVCSADLNDVAWQVAGNKLARLSNTLVKGYGNNGVSVGFELEPARFRLTARGTILTEPFTDPQMRSLAIVCAKISSYRNIPRQYITSWTTASTKDYANLRRLGELYGGGFFQHRDVSPARGKGSRQDAGAQFNILPGHKARIGSGVWKGTSTNRSDGDGPWMSSGWDTLWSYMAKTRRFQLATQVFTKEIPSAELQQLTQAAQAMQGSNSGQRATLSALFGRLAAAARAAVQVARGRREVYAKGMSRSTALQAILAATATNMSRTVARFDASALSAPEGPVMSYNEATGTWLEGDTDTGQM